MPNPAIPEPPAFSLATLRAVACTLLHRAHHGYAPEDTGAPTPVRVWQCARCRRRWWS